MAVSIYLDTQHISRAASGRNELAKFFLRSDVCFYYSVSHVVESLPKEPKENLGAISRLKIITGEHSKSLVGWGNVTEIERENQECNLKSLVCERPREMLFPGFSIDRKQWMRKVRDALKETLASEISDPNLRRSLQAKLLKHGKLTPAAFQFLRGKLQETRERVSSDIPESLPLIGDGGLYDFLEGRTSEEAFADLFVQSIGNPVALASMSGLHPVPKTPS